MTSAKDLPPGRGFVHLYTGNGKGKTTAALGLALRAVGAGYRVFIGQFVKGMPYAEITAIREFLPAVTVGQFGLDCFIMNQPTENDIRAARYGLTVMKTVIAEAKYQMVVLDEITIVLHYELFSIGEVLSLIKSKPKQTELILTGRYAPKALIEAADLVTDMHEVKHYYRKGIPARKGIEY